MENESMHFVYVACSQLIILSTQKKEIEKNCQNKREFSMKSKYALESRDFRSKLLAQVHTSNK